MSSDFGNHAREVLLGGAAGYLGNHITMNEEKEGWMKDE